MRTIVIMLIAFAFGYVISSYVNKQRGNKQAKIEDEEICLSEKHLKLFKLAIQWVRALLNGKRIEESLIKKGYREIAIYGMSYLGETLFDELKETGVLVKYCIDKNADRIYGDYRIVSPDGNLDHVDAVVITPITFYDEIAKDLLKRMDCDMVSLEDLIFD